MAASYPYMVKNSSFLQMLQLLHIIEEIRSHKWYITMFTDFMVFYLLEKSNEIFLYS